MTTLSSNTTHPPLSSCLYVIVITKTSPSCLTFTMITAIWVFVLSYLHTEKSDHRYTQLPFDGTSLLEKSRSLLFLNDWSVNLMANGWFRLNFDVWLVCVDVWGLFENANRLKYRTRNLQFSFRYCLTVVNVHNRLFLSISFCHYELYGKIMSVFISNSNLNFIQNYVKQYKQDCALAFTWGPSNNVSVLRQGQR